MNLKTGEWYKVPEFNVIAQLINHQNGNVILETAKGVHFAVDPKKVALRATDELETALYNIGLSGIATSMDKEIVQKMLDAGYRI